MPTIRNRLTAALFCAALVIAMAYAKSAELPGSQQSMLESVRESQSIFVGRFLSFGTAVPGPTAMTRFSNAQVAVEKSLLGGPTGTVNATFLFRTWPPEKKESMPEVGIPYVFFAVDSGNLEFLKVAPANPEVINEVQRLVEALGKTGPASSPAPREKPRINKEPTSTPLLHEASLLSPTPSSSLPLGRDANAARNTLLWPWVVGAVIASAIALLLLTRRR